MTQRKSRIVLILLLVIPMIALFSVDRHREVDSPGDWHQEEAGISSIYSCLEPETFFGWHGNPMSGGVSIKSIRFDQFGDAWRLRLEMDGATRSFNLTARQAGSSQGGFDIATIDIGAIVSIDANVTADVLRDLGDEVEVECRWENPTTGYPSSQSLWLSDAGWRVMSGGEEYRGQAGQTWVNPNISPTCIYRCTYCVDKRGMTYFLSPSVEPSTVLFSFRSLDGTAILQEVPALYAGGWNRIVHLSGDQYEAARGEGLATFTLIDVSGRRHEFHYVDIAADWRSCGIITAPERAREEIPELRKEALRWYPLVETQTEPR